MRGFQNCHDSIELIISTPDFPPESMWVLAPVTVEQNFYFQQKIIKNFCQNNAFDIKTVDPEKLKKKRTVA